MHFILTITALLAAAASAEIVARNPDGTPGVIAKPTKCGPKFGNAKCLADECCSRDGFCGAEEFKCDIGKGCQENFGKCFRFTVQGLPIGSASPDGTCGPTKPGFHSCPGNTCCSSEGFCGATNDHCKATRSDNNLPNCQPAYGSCTVPTSQTQIAPVIDTVNAFCGLQATGIVFACARGTCCSGSGYCGTSPQHCDKGCVKMFGDCTVKDPVQTKLKPDAEARAEQAKKAADRKAVLPAPKA